MPETTMIRLLALSLSLKGYDISFYTKTPSQAWFDCMYARDFRFAIFEAQVGYTFSNYSISQYHGAVRSGIRPEDVDFYIFPTFKRTAFDQVYDTIQRLQKAGVMQGRVWLDVENVDYWPANCTQNQDFVRDMVAAASTLVGKERVGIYTNWKHWEGIMCNTTEFSEHKIWWPRYDLVPDLDTNWVPTGGWATSYMKQYAGDDPECGEASVDFDFRLDE